MIKRYPKRYQIQRTEKALEQLGLGINNVEEFQSVNIKDFNEFCEDVPEVDYYSFATKKQELQLSELLRAGHEIICDHRVEWECDGMVEVEEQKWGQYLVTFDSDHFEVVGLNPQMSSSPLGYSKHGPRHVVNLVTDNLRVNEIKKEGGDFTPYETI